MGPDWAILGRYAVTRWAIADFALKTRSGESGHRPGGVFYRAFTF